MNSFHQLLVDGADEGEFCLNVTCPKDHFKCFPSGKCISLDKVCDQVEDCPIHDRIDGIAMDETSHACNSISNQQQSISLHVTCESMNFFRCKTIERCIHQNYVCE